MIADATKPIDVLNAVLEANDGKEVDVAVNCVNVANTEMSTILPVKIMELLISSPWQPDLQKLL